MVLFFWSSWSTSATLESCDLNWKKKKIKIPYNTSHRILMFKNSEIVTYLRWLRCLLQRHHVNFTRDVTLQKWLEHLLRLYGLCVSQRSPRRSGSRFSLTFPLYGFPDHFLEGRFPVHCFEGQEIVSKLTWILRLISDDTDYFYPSWKSEKDSNINWSFSQKISKFVTRKRKLVLWKIKLKSLSFFVKTILF